MTHAHHHWLSSVNVAIVEAYEREQERARDPARIQQVGHHVEAEWVAVLSRWLPPQYAVATRKYILLEGISGQASTGETDIVVFHPSYPADLRLKDEVLAGGVAAAFNVKRTIGRSQIFEACEEARLLRRSLKIRKATLRHELVPPILYGLLAESHEWKSPQSKPSDNVENSLAEFDMNLDSPREGLDLLCVADLACWRRMVVVLPMRLQDAHPDMDAGLRLGSRVGSGMINSDEPSSELIPTLSPLTRFVGALWSKLALNDPTLEPIAGGFRATEPALRGRAGLRNWKLADVVSDDVIDRMEAGPLIGSDWELGYF